MGELVYLFAVILLVGWLLGVAFFSLGGLIHAMLLPPVLVLLYRLWRRSRLKASETT